MKRYFTIFFFLFFSKFSYSQVNPNDSLIVLGYWNAWSLSANGGCFLNYTTQPALNWCHVGFWPNPNGRLGTFHITDGLIQNPASILPSNIGDLSEMYVLDIHNNSNLHGAIPPEIGNLTDLTDLILTDCNFNSSIPPELGNLSNLEILMIGNPGLVGTIPNTFGNLDKLFVITLRNSDLNGPLPGCFGLMDSLSSILMDLNYGFVSEIPDSLCMAPKLRQLLLRHNAFYGTIPSCLGNTNIVEIDISYNNFSGAVPASLFPEFGGHVNSFKADHNQLTSFPLIHYNYPYDVAIEDISYNKLQFADFEDIYLNGCSGCIGGLAPQDSVWSVLDTIVDLNSYVILNSTVTGNFNTYHWYKNDTLIGSSTNGLWQIPNIQYADSGIYTCNVTNQYVTPFWGLTLNRHPIILHVVNKNNIEGVSTNTNIVETYPNPCHNNVTIKLCQKGPELVAITIYDSKGSLVFKQRTTEFENNIITSEFENGLYLVRIETGDKVVLTKFTKE